MGKRKKPNNKLKKSLFNVARKVFSENPDSSLSHKQVCTLLDIRDKAIRKVLYGILEDLSRSGFLRKNGFDIYQLNHSENFIEGYIEITSRGTGYVRVDDGDDIFVAQRNLNKAIDGDLVKVQRINRGKAKPEGYVLEVVSRERKQFVGTIDLHESFAFLIPDNPKVGVDIYIPKDKLNGAKNGEKALVKITVWPTSKDSPYGEVLEVLGKSGGNDAEMISILVNNGLTYTFPEEVLSEAESVQMELDPKEVARRRDFRETTTFTIDPEDAKDFDDALSFKRLENGNLEIGIHIADVSHYVQPNSAMDKEALNRGNSVYLVDRVIPMLPEQLSNLVCSLRPHEDKFCFSAVFEMDESGKVYHEWFGRTVIHSDHRFTYEQAQEIIEGADGLYKDEVLLLDKIAKILRKRRLKAGALNIQSEEMRFRLGEDGNPVEVVIKTSKDAHKLIEEFMLLANRKVATFVASPDNPKQSIPFVYRCHDLPDPEKLEVFKLFVRKFGHSLDLNNPNNISKNINELLEEIKNNTEFSLIQSMAVRSMAKASYETENIGHYGLAFKYYTHFTSPIRRYADLIVHRILQSKLDDEKYPSKGLNDVCKRISRMERKAVEAERESTKYFQTLFVVDKVGQEFDGTVSGLAEFGLFVKMDENKCEGMIPINQLPNDRYTYDADRHCIIGIKTKKEYNFGDKVRVRIYEVSPRKRQIDLEIVE